MKVEELKYPKKNTWYIAYDSTKKEVKSHGSITPKQHFTTPWQKVDYFTDKKKWIKILEKNKIEVSKLKKD